MFDIRVESMDIDRRYLASFKRSSDSMKFVFILSDELFLISIICLVHLCVNTSKGIEFIMLLLFFNRYVDEPPPFLPQLTFSSTSIDTKDFNILLVSEFFSPNIFESLDM